MTWANRFKLFLGFIMVTVLVAASTLVFNQRQQRVDSETATIDASALQVGTDYGGLITEVLVEEGDAVTAGDPMFVLESMQLERDVAQGIMTAGESGVGEDGQFTVSATSAGTVADVAMKAGSYAQPSDVLAQIDEDGSLFIEAEFLLSPLDFGRIEDGATVEFVLPDQRTYTGTVRELTVETVEGEALATVEVASGDLVRGDANGLIVPGTPVEATLYLRDDGPLAGVADMVKDFLHRIGL